MFYDDLLTETATDRQILVTTPIIQAALGGKVTLDQYVAFLTQAYHHVHHTVPLLMLCAARLPDACTNSRCRSVLSAWRARWSRVFTALGVIPRMEAASSVSSSSMSRRRSTLL